jgi:iron complex outermembrane receptor protein
MRSIVIVLTVLAYAHASAQCGLSLGGRVTDIQNGQPISGVTLHFLKADRSFMTDNKGFFIADSICNLDSLMITAVGYALQVQSIAGEKTTMDFRLTPDISLLKSVVVTSEKKGDIATAAQSELKGIALFQTAGQSLGESLKNIPGLNSIQTGPSISKPVIHGLHSNRVLILNNGIRQEGQQWGSEHAPEIDPFIAEKVTIIKGAASVRYGSDAIAGVLLVEPRDLMPAKNMEGEVNGVAGSNGQMGALSAVLEGKAGQHTGLNWRVQGSLKQAGNFRAAHYYLTNTGLREADFSAAANYRNRKGNFGTDIYYSQFHNKVGIFEGSHVGNVEDLYTAFSRSRPITPSVFTYRIDRTYQQITHSLVKVSSFYQPANAGKIEAVFSYQEDKRDEYDIDLPYSADPAILKLPQISFQIKTHTLDLLYHPRVKNHFTGLWGVTGSTQGNVFRGIRYLVPNFRNYNAGLFAIERYTKNKWQLETGVRYDYRWLRVYRINTNNLQTYSNSSTYQNVTATVGASYRFSDRFTVSTNLGSGWRAPSVNELYIDGIHLSAASYEKGDSSLRSERSYDFTVSGKYNTDRLYAELVLYNNRINHFIYAKPSLTPITLISGTYPLFNYTQVDANLMGFDAELRYQFWKGLSLDSKTSVLRARNLTIHDWLVFMPADRFDNALKYEVEKWGRMQKLYVSAGWLNVLRQTRTPANSDYVPPPGSYHLLNANIGFVWPLKRQQLSFELAGTNLINAAYRDYLNRFRYYADDLGRDLVLRAKITF